MSEEMIKKTYEEVVALKDLFLRRLMDDKVKLAAITQLDEENKALHKKLDEKNLTAFIKELLMVCDRIDCQKEIDSLTASVEEEIIELLERREIYQMEPPVVFNPRFHNAVGTVPATDSYPDKSVVRVVRNGYMLRDEIFRPADVIVAVEMATDDYTVK